MSGGRVDSIASARISEPRKPLSDSIRAAVDSLLDGINCQSGMTLMSWRDEDVGTMSAHEAKLRVDALDIIAQETQRRSANLRKHLNSLTAVLKLPNEVIATFLILALVQSGQSPANGEGFARRRAQLARVCSHWRFVIDSTPAFWTTIKNQDPLLAASLQKSKDALLDILWSGPLTSEASSFFQELNPRREKWRTITIDTLADDVPVINSPQDADLDTFSDLFGSNLEVLQIILSHRFSARWAHIQIPKSPSMKTLLTRGIGVRMDETLQQPLPSLTVLSMEGFAETADQWNLVLRLISVSPSLEVLKVVPERSGHSHDVTEVNHEILRPLELSMLQTLKLHHMPQKMFDYFIRFATLTPARLTTLQLRISEPLDETLDAILQLSDHSLAHVIQHLSAAQPSLSLTATVGHTSDNLAYMGDDDVNNDGELSIDIEGSGIVSRIIRRRPSIFDYDGIPPLRFSFSGHNLGSIENEDLKAIIEATPSTCFVEVRRGFPMTDILGLLQEKKVSDGSEAMSWWPNLKFLFVPNLADMKLESLLDILHERVDLRVRDSLGQTLDSSGDILTDDEFEDDMYMYI